MVGETGGGRLFVGVDPNPSPSCLDSRSSARDTAGRGDAARRVAARAAGLARGPPIGDGELGRVRGAAGRAIPDRAADVRLASGASCALEPGDRARCLSPRRAGTHGSRLAQVWRRADGQLCSSISRGPRRSRRTPIRLSVLSSCWRQSPRAHLLPPPSRPRRCRPQTLLNRLASGAPPALADVKAELLRLASIPNRPSRIRRALPMVMATMPVAVPILTVTVMLPMFARSLEGEPET